MSNEYPFRCYNAVTLRVSIRSVAAQTPREKNWRPGSAAYKGNHDETKDQSLVVVINGRLKDEGELGQSFESCCDRCDRHDYLRKPLRTAG